ncbi:MAG: threonine/serine dehydratase [Pseudomonadota bacterium]
MSDPGTATPTIDDAFAAAERLKPFFLPTPLIEAPSLSGEIGVRIFGKVDALLPSGAFKYRGALNFLLQLSDDDRARGVVAFSTGNHAQAVALAAQKLGIRAKIVMPRDAPTVKIENTRAYGGDIHLFDRQTESREAIADEYAQQGMVLLPPFDHPHVVAGQATSGLEIFDHLKQLKVDANSVLVCSSGGGLLAGISLAAQALSPATHVIAVEPAVTPVWCESLKAGRAVAVPYRETICDALAPANPEPGSVPWAVVKSHLAEVIGVHDDGVVHAMEIAERKFGLCLEPGGAIALAAAIEHRERFADQTLVVTLSGRNRDF